MKVLKRVGLGLVAVVLLFVIVVMTRPSTFRIERSATVAAPPEAVYAQVADFHALGAVVAVGAARPGPEEDLRRARGRPRRVVRVVGQRRRG